MQMGSKRAANRAASQEDITSDDSSNGKVDFVIAARPRRAVRKTRVGASSSLADTEVADMAEGRAVREEEKQGKMT
jgi:hypothetical protein